MPHPCVTKIFKYQEAGDENWVFADGSCFIQDTGLTDLKDILEDLDHYVQVPQSFERDAERDPTGMPIIKDGFRYIEVFQPLDSNYSPIAKERRIEYPTLVYGRIRTRLLAFDIRSHYLIDVWPAHAMLTPKFPLTTQTPDPPIDFSKEYDDKISNTTSFDIAD
jgi:hypothetical protein